MQRRVLCALLVLGGIVLPSGCGREKEEGGELCSALLARTLPSARVLEARRESTLRRTLRFEATDGDGERVEGTFRCELETARSGGLRVKAVLVDGRELSEEELVLINADLLLDDLRRHAPGATEPGGPVD